MILMSTVTIAVIVAAVIVIAVLVTGVAAVRRRRRLQHRFGPEYDRLAGERDSKRKAESELAGRERRVRGLDIQPLADSARAAYALRWATIQEQFVDTPEHAVASSQLLVTAVVGELGYPSEDPDQMLADLSVRRQPVRRCPFRRSGRRARSAGAHAASPGIRDRCQGRGANAHGRSDARRRSTVWCFDIERGRAADLKEELQDIRGAQA